MFVRFLGFTLSALPIYSLDLFMRELADRPIAWSENNGPGRFLFVDTKFDEQYYLGLIVTVKDQRRFCQLREGGTDRLQIMVNEPDQTSRLMEFNFFVINRISQVGLYQHYYQSCSLREGMKELGNLYRDLLLGHREVYVKELLDQGASKIRANELARQHFHGALRYTQLVSPADFQEMLNELSSITALELEYTSLRVEQPTYAQLSQYVKRESHKIVFNRQFTAGSGLIRAIMSLVETDKPDSGKVTGSDESGIERVIRIDNNPYTFGEFDFDEIVEKIHQLNIKEFHQSWVISKLLSTCREQSELFETEAQ